MVTEGFDPRPERPALAEALRALTLPKRLPDEADVPPPSTLPLTPAARAALAMKRAERKRRGE